MPNFLFKCDTCDKQFERYVPTWGERNPPCPECGEAASRQPSAPAFRVNGFNARNGYSESKG